MGLLCPNPMTFHPAKLKDLDKFYEIHLKIKKKEFDRKIRATYTKNFKPFIYLYKKKFILC
jgi:hypothetical protein